MTQSDGNVSPIFFLIWYYLMLWWRRPSFHCCFFMREAKANHPHLSIALVPKRHHLSNFSFGCRTILRFILFFHIKIKMCERERKKAKIIILFLPFSFAGKGYGNIKERTEYTSVGELFLKIWNIGWNFLCIKRQGWSDTFWLIVKYRRRFYT